MLNLLFSRVTRYLKYLFGYVLLRKPRILSLDKTLKIISERHLSIARFGDGELKMICKAQDIHFQDASDALIEDLKRCLAARDNRLLICVTESLRLMGKKYKKSVVRFYRWQLGLFYRRYYRFLDFSYRYGNANISRFYMDYKNPKKSNVLSHVRGLQMLWDKRNLLIVEGSGTKLGAMTDLLDNAKQVRRILCPNKNAYDCISTIKMAIYRYYEFNDLIILCLGPTASILATDISIERGYQCLDLGHIDVEYIWFKNGASEKTQIQGMNSAEAPLGDDPIVTFFDEEKYRSQIVCSIHLEDDAEKRAIFS